MSAFPLKPCPFCGGEARLFSASLPMLADCADIQVSCEQCDAIGPGILFDQTEHGESDIPELEREAREAWNARAALSPNMDHAVGGVLVTPEIDKALRSSLMRSHTLVEVLPSATPPVNQDAVRDALEEVRLIVEGEAYKVAADQKPCKHTAALNEIHDTVTSALATPPLDNTGLDAAKDVTYVLQHNPNCPSPYLVRLCGKGTIDMKPYVVTSDRFGFGKTFGEAYAAALASGDRS